MNELRRMAYLEALEIDCYVSRAQLPGAALTRRLAIVPAPVETVVAEGRVDSPGAPKAAVPPVSPMQQEGVTRPDFGPGLRGASATVESPREPLPGGEPVPRFSLSTIIAGDWLWLEELDGMPLATEQVHLVQSMAQALVLARGIGSDNTRSAAGTQATRPDVAQFDWPMHTNRQLDQGADAVRASVAAFVSRRLEQRGCRGLVLLGQTCVKRLPLPQMKVLSVSTASSAEILASPALKRQVWRDLQPLLQKP
jgi:hypothetical protein